MYVLMELKMIKQIKIIKKKKMKGTWKSVSVNVMEWVHT